MLESKLTLDEKHWVNSKLHNNLYKDIDEFNFLDDYVYSILQDFAMSTIRGKIYTYTLAGMGHILVMKRNDRYESITYKFFDTNNESLPIEHEYIKGYKNVNHIIELIKENRLKKYPDNRLLFDDEPLIITLNH